MSRKAWTIVGCGVLIVLVAGGLRQSFGVFLRPVSLDLAIGREVFGLVIAAQALLYGVAQPLVGLAADRLGAMRIVVAGALVYALGLWLASQSQTATGLFVSLGLLVGLGLSGATQVVVLGAVSRAVPAARRGLAFGTIIASGSLGMFLFVPGVQLLIGESGWRQAFVVTAVVIALLPLVALGLRERPAGPARGPRQPLREALREARSHSGYLLLTAGFFVCGFHVTFVGTHLPAYLTDAGVSPQYAAYALGLIGLCNVGGAYLFGALADRFSPKNLLVCIYLGRSVLMGLVLVVPMTDVTALVFGAVMGFLWLATVPLTSGIVAQIFGTRYFSMLYGVVFMSHQLGSFCGAWLGGFIYDHTGSYDAMWMAAVAAGIVAALVHWPISLEPAGEPARA